MIPNVGLNQLYKLTSSFLLRGKRKDLQGGGVVTIIFQGWQKSLSPFFPGVVLSFFQSVLPLQFSFSSFPFQFLKFSFFPFPSLFIFFLIFLLFFYIVHFFYLFSLPRFSRLVTKNFQVESFWGALSPLPPPAFYATGCWSLEPHEIHPEK